MAPTKRSLPAKSTPATTLPPAKKAKKVESQKEIISEVSEIEEFNGDEEGTNDDEDGDDDEGDFHDADEDEGDEKPVAISAPSGKKGKGKGKDYRPPTNEELQGMKETEQLFKSNVFRLQVEELLKEVKVVYPKLTKLEAALHALRSTLETIPAIGEKSIDEATEMLKKKGVILPIEIPEGISTNFKLAFNPPKNVDLVGSYLLRTIAKPHLNVDIAVEMPEELFRNKDHLSYCYFLKRAYFLSVIASALSKEKKKVFGQVKFAALNGNSLKPILVLHPSEDDSETDFSKTKFVIRLIPTVSPSVFSLSRLHPDKNGIRNPQIDEDCTKYPTPHYNNDILNDMFMKDHLSLLHTCAQDSPGFVDAIVLGKVWLHQRQMTQQEGRVDGFILSMLLAYLFQQRKVNRQMSSYQILRVLMQFIASHDLHSKPLRLKADPAQAQDAPSVETFQEHFELVFLDASGRLNFLARITKLAWEEFRHQANLAQDYFKETLDDTFGALFLEKQSAYLKYDNTLRFNQLPQMDADAFKDLKQERLDWNDWNTYLSFAIPTLLSRGLNKRITKLAVSLSPIPEWSLAQSLPSPQSRTLTVGICLDSAHAYALVDHGPPADDAEKSKEFKAIWGQKAELRRFKDGAILQAAVWENLKDRRNLIVQHAVAYLLKLHFGISAASFSYFAAQFDTLLVDPSFSKPADSFTKPIHAFEQLLKHIKSLDLPLSISTFQAVSPTLRYTEAFIPQPVEDHSTPIRWVPFLDVILQFESSGHWPDDLDAIKHTKTAFYLRMATELQNQLSLESTVTDDWIEVKSGGFTFRVVIFHQRDLLLLQKTQDAKICQQFEIDFIHRPKLAASIHTLSTQHTSYSTAVRLAKRWIHSHLFASLISEEAMELLVASVFLNPRPYDPPTSPFVAFLRFLQLLSDFDWAEQPLIVNLDQELTAQSQTEIIHHFNSTNPESRPALFIATPDDRHSAHWTAKTPTPMIRNRLAKFAQSSLKAALQGFEAPEHFNFKSLFLTPLKDYDVVIKLRAKGNPRGTHGVSYTPDLASQAPNKFKNLREAPPLPGFDPVKRFVQELQTVYGDLAIFLFDELGGEVIAMVWKPTAFIPAPFKVSSAFSKIPLTTEFPASFSASLEALSHPNGAEANNGKKSKKPSDKGILTLPNIVEIVANIKQLGAGLVKDVVVQ